MCVCVLARVGLGLQVMHFEFSNLTCGNLTLGSVQSAHTVQPPGYALVVGGLGIDCRTRLDVRALDLHGQVRVRQGATQKKKKKKKKKMKMMMKKKGGL